MAQKSDKLRGFKSFFKDDRQYSSVQRVWSKNVGGYRGKYERHHWWKPQSEGGSNAGWNLVAASPKLNNAMGNGGALYQTYRAGINGGYVAATSGLTHPIRKSFSSGGACR